MPIEQTNIVPGSIMEGKVQGITKFGAFIELPGGVVGLVHISEIADTYVKDVKDFIKEGDSVKVKVLNVAGKKIGLSIKQVSPPPKSEPKAYERNYRSSTGSSSNRYNNPIGKSINSPISLDDKIAKFLKESDERMQPLKNKMEPRKRNRFN
ncbi:MAG: S1 RNA-binding domain-containing protein [Syntrophomonas sp.]|uniref:S1 RNA-binding domain-containing protein n=1 Tax=Syntrophomonas sp. TaxID=2053627 RepID=UPI0026176CE1|nr:S1 RNA-binding domain-containing protein [Syntrophomonas sp.]MDD2510458.1 S1 RNA-binding domain-containing protein [Syntrophomonas sp.]MDD3880138.1 S1 RNA-binding domain-containing protein [Syntrophomonas sp.]MDD4627281.1 S1 RNA-binding domain-containing protein [Syntrophomonas sp.]